MSMEVVMRNGCRLVAMMSGVAPGCRGVDTRSAGRRAKRIPLRGHGRPVDSGAGASDDVR